MRMFMKCLAAGVLAITALVGLSASPATGQAATGNCPPGQPSGRPPGTPPGEPPVNTGRPAYPPGRCQLALSRAAAARGDTFQASGAGFAPGESVTLSIAGRPVMTLAADANGAFSVALTVPDDAPIGRTQVLATAASLELVAAFEVLAPPGQAQSASPARAAALLSRTGADIAATAAAGVVLVLGGLFGLLTARQRRRPVADPA